MQEPRLNGEIQILDIRSRDAARQLADQIVKGLDAPFNKKILPIQIQYDEVGLLLFDKFCSETPEYYVYGVEMEMLKEHGDEMVQLMHNHTGNAIVPGEAMIELGAGSLRKTSHLLRALSDMLPISSPVPPVTYFALDLHGNELRRTLTEIHNSDIGPFLSGKVETKGLWGTYENGFEFVLAGGLGSSDERGGSTPLSRATSGANTMSTTCLGRPPIHFVFLGGTIGLFHRGEDAQFLRSIPLRPGDTLLLALSHHNKREEFERAYNDPKDLNIAFTMNALDAAGKALGSPGLFDRDNWEFFNRYDDEKRCIEGFYKCLRSHEIRPPGYNRSVQFLQGELVQLTVSTKYTESDISTLFADARLQPIQHWVDSTNRHSLWLLERLPIVAENSPSA